MTKKNWNIQCEFCKMKGHTKDGCYKIIRYPSGFKGKKRGNVNSAYNACAENVHPNVAAGNSGIPDVFDKSTGLEMLVARAP